VNHIDITSSDGVKLPLSWYPAKIPQWTLLFLPALGIQCRMYETLAKILAASGCSACLMEQRGHGRSPIRASRTVNWGYDDYLEKDIPATLRWIQQQETASNTPMILAGHSLGGHLSSIYSGQHPGQVDGVAHVACGSPYYADFSMPFSLGIRLLCHIQPVFRVFSGYFPGSLVGFAGRESLQLMRDWRDWASTGRLDYGQHRNLHDDVANFTGPVLAISMAGDKYSSKKAEQTALQVFTRARISQLRIGDESTGDMPGHFAWARKPERVSQAILEWLGREFV